MFNSELTKLLVGLEIHFVHFVELNSRYYVCSQKQCLQFKTSFEGFLFYNWIVVNQKKIACFDWARGKNHLILRFNLTADDSPASSFINFNCFDICLQFILKYCYLFHCNLQLAVINFSSGVHMIFIWWLFEKISLIAKCVFRYAKGDFQFFHFPIRLIQKILSSNYKSISNDWDSIPTGQCTPKNLK